MPDTVELYSDGACSGNPGPGGWACLLRSRGRERTLSGGEAMTTNNRMELTAVLRGFEKLKRSCAVQVYTDSLYVRDGITLWAPRWLDRGWKNAKGKPVKNRDLWTALVDAVAEHDVEWHWVRGHSGHPENEFVDQLAREAIPAT